MDTRNQGMLSRFWSKVAGREMCNQLLHKMVPALRWNQEMYGCALDQYVNSGVHWLDAGCGRTVLRPSLEAQQVRLTAKPRLLVGADIDSDSIRDNSSVNAKVCSQMDALPLAGESFDVITCNMVVEHLENPERTFRELARVLRPGGIIVVHTPNRLNYIVIIGHFVKSVLPRAVVLKLIGFIESRKEADIFPTFYRANTLRKLRRLMEKAGLREVETRMWVGPHPICNFIAPLALVELAMMRMMLSPAFRSFRTTMFGVYKKQEVPVEGTATALAGAMGSLGES